MKNLITSLLFLSFFACTTFAQSDYLAYADIPYLKPTKVVNDSLQRLDLLVPKSKTKTPLLIWIGGGAWSYVDRSQEKDLAKQFVKEKIAFASIGHRNSPAIWRDEKLSEGVEHPEHIKDLAAAVKWLHDNALEYNLDTSRFFIGGFSSGAHLAALLVMDPSYLNKVGLSKSLLKGIIPISGTFDIPHYHSVFLNGSRPELAKLHVEAVFGSNQSGWENASPVFFLKNLSTPILLMADNGVYNYSQRFENALREIEYNKITSIYAHDLSHAELWRDLSLNPKSIYRQAILSFLQANS